MAYEVFRGTRKFHEPLATLAEAQALVEDDGEHSPVLARPFGGAAAIRWAWNLDVLEARNAETGKWRTRSAGSPAPETRRGRIHPRCVPAVYPSTGGCRERKLATKTLIEYVDDLDGSPGAETVRFSLDGTLYEIDLNGSTLRRSARRWPRSPRRAARCGRSRPPGVRGHPGACCQDPHVGAEQRLQGGEGGTHPRPRGGGVHRSTAEHAHAGLTAGMQKTAPTGAEGQPVGAIFAIPGPGSASAGKCGQRGSGFPRRRISRGEAGTGALLSASGRPGTCGPWRRCRPPRRPARGTTRPGRVRGRCRAAPGAVQGVDVSPQLGDVQVRGLGVFLGDDDPGFPKARRGPSEGGLLERPPGDPGVRVRGSGAVGCRPSRCSGHRSGSGCWPLATVQGLPSWNSSSASSVRSTPQ